MGNSRDQNEKGAVTPTEAEAGAEDGEESKSHPPPLPPGPGVCHFITQGPNQALPEN